MTDKAGRRKQILDGTPLRCELPKALYDELRAFAEREGRTIAGQVRLFISRGLTDATRQRPS